MNQPLLASSSLRSPAAVVHFWWPRGQDHSALVEPLLASLAARPGVLALGERSLAVIPVAGSYDVSDVAAGLARHVLREIGGGCRALICPGWLEQAGGAPRVDDQLHSDLARRPPELLANTIYLTSHAAHDLEGRWRLLPRGVYEAPSGARIPLLRLGRRRPLPEPRRNPHPLGRSPKPIPRPHPLGALRAAWEEPVLVVSGALGVGKSQLVWEALEGRRELRLWGAASGERSFAPDSLAEQWLSQLRMPPGEDRDGRFLHAPPDAERSAVDTARVVAAGCHPAATRAGHPVRLIVDDWERAAPAERALVVELLRAPGLGTDFRLTLVARNGFSLPAEAHDPREVAVPPFDPDEMGLLGERLTSGLSLPKPVLERLLTACAGVPFALEEGLHGYARAQFLRQVYGSFFFGADSSAGYTPSPRWIRHVEAEALRLGEPAPLRALALAEPAVPAATLRLAARELGAAPDADWTRPYLEAQWLRAVAGPWGSGLEFTCPAVGAALEKTLLPEGQVELKRTLGELLAGLAQGGPASWQAYRLLSGSREALPCLLQAVHSKPPGAPSEQLLDALVAELGRLSGAPQEIPRLEVLWALLPLAHKAGVLRLFRRDLDEAIALAAAHSDRVLALRALKAEVAETEGHLRAAEFDLRGALKTAIARESDEDRKALLSIRYGRVLLREERYEEARRLFAAILPVFERAGRRFLISSCHFYLGNIALNQHQLGEARDHHEQALQIRRARDVPQATAASLSALSSVALLDGDYPRALALAEEARATAGGGSDASYALLAAGRALDRMGDFAAAAPLLREALRGRRGGADPVGEAVARLAAAENLLNLEQPEAAEAELIQAHYRLSLNRSSRVLGDAEQMLGRVFLSRSNPREASQRLATALEIHRTREDAVGTAFDLAWSLEAAILLRDDATAQRLTCELREVVNTIPYPERGEILDLRLFRAHQWLRGRGRFEGDPRPYLERGYAHLLHKTAALRPEQRNRFLLQVPTNRELMEAATLHGLALPR